ncbi:MAG: hypothetical protein FD123_1826 [Bacteroidetes bacterium]|nr:MAG: hypothetical protein FD123_1826 [Bacteroidota bacterium]
MRNLRTTNIRQVERLPAVQLWEAGQPRTNETFLSGRAAAETCETQSSHISNLKSHISYLYKITCEAHRKYVT